MNIPNRVWKIRAVGEKPEFKELYGSTLNSYFTSLEIFHGGNFTATPGRDYVRPKITIVDFVEVYKLSYELLLDIIKFLGCKGKKGRFYRVEKYFGLELGLMKLESTSDFEKFYNFIFPQKCNHLHRIYVEMDRKPQIAFFPNSLKKANHRYMEKMRFEFVFDHPHATIKEAREFLFREYDVRISPTVVMPGLYAARANVSALNNDD